MTFVKLAEVDPGSTVRFPFSGMIAQVLRQGTMATAIRPSGERVVVLTPRDTGDPVQFVTGRDALLVSPGSEVEVLPPTDGGVAA